MDRPIPQPTALDEPFWTAAAADRLVVQRGADGRTRMYPRATCLTGGDATWVDADTGGEIVTFSVVHRSFYPELPAPYVVAVVRLGDGTQLMVHVVDCEPDAVTIGMGVRVVFRPAGDGVVPAAVPA